jgi:ComF family protein
MLKCRVSNGCYIKSLVMVKRLWLKSGFLVAIVRRSHYNDPRYRAGGAVNSKELLLAFKESLWAIFFPPSCAFCNSSRAEFRTGICTSCLESVRRVSEPFCTQCGLPVPGLSLQESGLCGRCLIKPPPYRKARYAVYYEGPLRDALISFKFGRALDVSRTLSHFMVEAFHKHFSSDEFDIIIPVPLHQSRLLQRGFNQAVILGHHIAASTGLPLERSTLLKVKDTPPQVGLPRAQRVANLRNSFATKDTGKIRGKRVLLVDDVATTGSTLTEAAKTLMKSGATTVGTLALALRTADSLNLAPRVLDVNEQANSRLEEPGKIGS